MLPFKKTPFCLCIILFIFTFSCSGKFLSAPKNFQPVESLSYCSLLNVTQEPHPVIKPKPYLGIYLAYKKLELLDLPCKDGFFVQVGGVINGTAASEAGLMEDDMILTLNGKSSCENQENVLSSFKKMIQEEKIGSTVKLDVMRGDQKLSLTATLLEMPTHNQQEAYHPEIERCPLKTSKLADIINSQNAMPVFNNILESLYLQSNAIHNPGWLYEKEFNPLQLKEMTYLMRHPLSAGVVAKEMSRQLISPLHEKNWIMKDFLQGAGRLIDIEVAPSDSHPEITFPELLRIMEETKNRIEQALSNLTSEEKALLREKALSPWGDSKWDDILEISMKIDRKKLLTAFTPFLSFLAKDNLDLLKKDILKRFGHNKGSVLYETETPIGKVIAGGDGPNVYRADAALILDLGGDDLYLNNAGGTRPGMPVAMVIDWGGNDSYISKENFSQAAGVLGSGVLIDLGGNDTFVSLDGSQGTGFWGIGFLYHGDGSSIFNSRKLSQGAGQMGIGLIVNRKGDSKYLCSYLGQALGLFGGAGILIDESGADYYQLGGMEPDFRDPLKSTVSMGQGFGYGIRPEKKIKGIPGGIGILIDANGDDTYLADYFAQGASYYYGIGILNDTAGNDNYISGRYSQGAGIHSSVGILADEKGNDFYYSSFGVAQGMGHDYGVGFLEDDEGDDNYFGGILVQGAVTNGSLGIFMDLQGNNQYSCTNKGQAYADETKSMGIMIEPETTADSQRKKDNIVINLGVKNE